MHTKSFALALLLTASVGQLCAQHTGKIKEAVSKIPKHLPSSKASEDGLFHPNANIENEDGMPILPKSYTPPKGWDIKMTGGPTYHRGANPSEYIAKVKAKQTWANNNRRDCVIIFLIRPDQVQILDVINQPPKSDRESRFHLGPPIKESDVTWLPQPPQPTADNCAAEVEKMRFQRDQARGAAKNASDALVGVKRHNVTLSGENTSFRQQLTQLTTRYIQDTARLKSAYDALKKKYDQDQPRLKRYREKELRDSLTAVARKRRAEAAQVSNDSAIAKYERAYKDFYEVKPPIKPDSLNRAIHDVIDMLVANDSFLSPKALFIMANIFGRSEGGAWLYDGPVPGTGGQDMKDAPDRRNPVTIGYIARGIEMADSLNDLQIKQEFQEILRNFPEYVRAGMGTDPPAKSLDDDLTLFFEDKDYLTAANEIRQHLPYLNDTIYTTTLDGLLINAKIKYAYGCILLWNLGDINGSKGLLSSNNKFLAEVNGRVTKGEEYLLEVIAMKQFLLRKEARTLLENGASRSKITNDKSLNSQEIEVIKVILDAKTALYKHYQ